MTGTSEGKVTIVTGAVSGIGEAAAALLLEQGWRVAMLDRDEKGLERLRGAHAGNKGVLVAALDVTDETAAAAMAERIEAELGPIHGVVNSAGIATDKHVFDTDPAVFRRILDVNVVGTFIVGKVAARHMAKRNTGAIVNLASVSGMRGNKGRVAYGASKGAVINLTQVMANDLAMHGIRVNAVAPGPTETAMIKAIYTEADRALWMPYLPLVRFATPREIAQVIAFLLDAEKAAYITAAVYPVDGGFVGAGISARPLGGA